jgi:hypothetical protein
MGGTPVCGARRMRRPARPRPQSPGAQMKGHSRLTDGLATGPICRLGHRLQSRGGMWPTAGSRDRPYALTARSMWTERTASRFGPISIEPAPPTRFSGVVTGSRLTVNVMPSGSRLPASYSITQTSAGTCPIPCV